MTQQEFEKLLPLACEWITEQERCVLGSGVPLTDEQQEDARSVGVTSPERVRVLRVRELPQPNNPALLAAGLSVGLFTPAAEARAVRYGIFVRSDCWSRRELLRHELVHTAQYERLGGIESFLRQYVRELMTCGYHHSPLEQEARRSQESCRMEARSNGADGQAQPHASYCGLPWKNGGSSRAGVSCSGLVWLWLHEEMGFQASPPTLLAGTAMECRAMPEFKQSWQAGDVVFFRNRKSGRIEHCAVCTGGEKLLHILRGCESRADNGTTLMRRLGFDVVGALSPEQAHAFYLAIYAEQRAQVEVGVGQAVVPEVARAGAVKGG